MQFIFFMSSIFHFAFGTLDLIAPVSPGCIYFMSRCKIAIGMLWLILFSFPDGFSVIQCYDNTVRQRLKETGVQWCRIWNTVFGYIWHASQLLYRTKKFLYNCVLFLVFCLPLIRFIRRLAEYLINTPNFQMYKYFSSYENGGALFSCIWIAKACGEHDA